MTGPEDPTGATDCLMTGADYLDSLRDGRQVYIYGEPVKDVTAHPAFRNAALSVSRLYDALHDPATRDVLTTVDHLGQRTHRFFTPSRSAAELMAAREAIACWSRMNYGFMGRSPDYKASFMAGLAANPEFYEPYSDNAREWYRRYASRGLYLNHVIVNPPIDRKKPVHEMADVLVHVVRETDGGIVVSGVKMLATGSAITNATFVAQNSAAQLEPGRAEDFALVFFAHMDNPGTKLICRSSYEQRAVSPFDHPLSSRFDENDAVLVFDNAFIPWEDVLVYRDIERSRAFYAQSGFANRYNFQSGIRLGVKLDFMSGLISRGAHANGTDEFRGVQASIGEVINIRNTVWALTAAMAADPEPGANGTVLPKLEYASAIRMYATMAWDQIRALFETTLGGAPLVVPSSNLDLLNPELRPLIDRYYRGSDSSAEARVKLFKLVWDAIGGEFGSRHALYERNYSGNTDQVRLDALNWARRRGQLAQFEEMVGRCMDDYDLSGWTRGPWAGPAS
ncbi:MAG TPA: 4-hydroxyphenylacetate 3-hydroxylase family protein [Mycobacteriales bacterium]|jgi:Aromatic ring hydroxylase